uniref:Uncharacterized protein n=1 Tax=Oryza brachyantha TaxID=4533 RepID=J3MTK7_ORYBR
VLTDTILQCSLYRYKLHVLIDPCPLTAIHSFGRKERNNKRLTESQQHDTVIQTTSS